MMTPADLDRWLAQNVMQWTLDERDFWIENEYGGRASAKAILHREACEDCEEWHPTQNIAQAIECAEEALAALKIGKWWIGRHVGGLPDHGCLRTNGDPVIPPKTCPPAEALCRALYDALSTPPVAGL